jgi:hypothetical protein
MPVEKFRSIEAMNAARPRPRAEDDVERFFRHCARMWALAPRTYPRGVQMFHDITEAQRAAEREGHR